MRRSNEVLVLVCPLLLVLSDSGARAEQAPSEERLTVADFLDWESVSDPQISPDGSQVVYTRRWVNQLEDRWESALWIINTDGTKNRFLVKGSNARWSPDGTRIAYLAEGEPGGTQVYVRWMDAEGATTQVTRVTEAPGNLKWSPDGKIIALTMLVEKKISWDIKMPKPPKKASWTEPPRIIESTHYRQDRRGFMREGYVHLFVVPADGGTPRQLTEGDWDVGARPYGLRYGAAIDWTPDGKEIIFDGLLQAEADRRYRESHLYAVDVETRSIRQITKAKGPWGNPVVSPDGQSIAFTGFQWTPQTYKATELYVIGRDGSNQRKISGELDRDPRDLRWAADGSGAFFTVADRGTSNVHFASLEGKVRQTTQGTHMLSLSSRTDGETAVGIRSSFHEPPDVVRFNLLAGAHTPTRLTQVNDDVLAGRKLAEVEEIWYESSGGTKVQGWIVKPPEFDPERKHPLILHIHGGPHAMYNVGFNFSFQHLAACGYVVLYTNPRGSTGYGTDFGNAIDNAYPSADYDDLMAGVDAVLATGYVDPDRLYVTGVSGGGVLSSWTIGHTDRFAAAAVRAPVTNWISFAGTTDVTAWGFYRFRSHFWENPDLWLKHSPLMYVSDVKTPTLLMTGELDLRTPMGQTEEYYQALRALKVPTAMIRFNEEYHGTGSKPSNFMRTQLYLMNWFERYPGGSTRTAHMSTGFRIGEVTPNSAIVWTRLTKHAQRNWTGIREPTKREPRQEQYVPSSIPVADRHGAAPGRVGQVRVHYSTNKDLSGAEVTDWVTVKKEHDFVHQFRLSRLKPGTPHYVKVEARGSADEPASSTSTGSFGTPAPLDRWQDVRFAVITGQAYWDLDHPDGYHIYPAMQKLNLDFLIPTGDTVYLDSEAPRARTVELALYHWHRMYSLPRLVEFHRHVPGYWEKDDHDSWCDDCWPTKKALWMNPITFEQGLEIFRQQVPMGERTYRTIRWGKGLQIWLVEGRDYRSPNNMPDGPEKTIWGEEQLAWLKRTVLQSDADFRVLISPTPIVGPDRTNKADNHSNQAFAYEGNQFRTWTMENNLENFYVCCGDRHWQYMSIDPKTELLEFSCGPASDVHAGGSPGHRPEIQPFHRELGGFLTVSVTKENGVPTIAFRHHDVHGKVVHEFKAQSAK